MVHVLYCAMLAVCAVSFVITGGSAVLYWAALITSPAPKDVGDEIYQAAYGNIVQSLVIALMGALANGLLLYLLLFKTTFVQ